MAYLTHGLKEYGLLQKGRYGQQPHRDPSPHISVTQKTGNKGSRARLQNIKAHPRRLHHPYGSSTVRHSDARREGSVQTHELPWEISHLSRNPLSLVPLSSRSSRVPRVFSGPNVVQMSQPNISSETQDGLPTVIPQVLIELGAEGALKRCYDRGLELHGLNTVRCVRCLSHSLVPCH